MWKDINLIYLRFVKVVGAGFYDAILLQSICKFSHTDHKK